MYYRTNGKKIGPKMREGRGRWWGLDAGSLSLSRGPPGPRTPPRSFNHVYEAENEVGGSVRGEM